MDAIWLKILERTFIQLAVGDERFKKTGNIKRIILFRQLGKDLVELLFVIGAIVIGI